MQTLLQKRITRLRWLSAFLLLSVTGGWVWMMFYLPFFEGETFTSVSIKCALVVALVLIGKVPSRVTSGVRSASLWMAFIIYFFFTPLSIEVWTTPIKVFVAVIIITGIVDLVVEARLWQLTKHSKLYYH